MRSPPRLEIEAASRSTGGVPLAACAPVSRIHGQYAAPGIQRNTTRILFALLAVHIGLVAWGAWRHSPTFDEAAHLGAGLSHWRLGRFDAYRVNPPLVRMIAAVPLVLLDADAGIPWDGFPSDPGLRPEYYLGHKFIAARGSGSLWWLTVARWTCIPFSVLGAWICFCWARDLYGERSALLAAALWCFCPTLIGNAELMTPDVGGAALGLAAAYTFWRWLNAPVWGRAIAAGIAMGLAELSKTTWIVLFLLWPVLWLVWRVSAFVAFRSAKVSGSSISGCDTNPKRQGGPSLALRVGVTAAEICTQKRKSQVSLLPSTPPAAPFTQLIGILVLAVYLVNLGYGFEGSFTRLGDFQFISRLLADQNGANAAGDRVGNRFAGSWLGYVPAPFPANYVQGIDAQRHDFEGKMWSYLRGEWRLGGWWYYYLYAMAVKVPLGTWAIGLLAAIPSGRGAHRTCSWRDVLVLLAPAVIVLALVSSQTGFNHHLRYVLPVFPFAFVWVSKVAASRRWYLALAASAAVTWSITSSLWIYPHSLSYFNEIAGGPKGGPAHLTDSNIDWGQDLLYLRSWLERHPEAHPVGVAGMLPRGLLDPNEVGIACTVPPPGPDTKWTEDPPPESQCGPLPGWYAISVYRLLNNDRRYDYFRLFRPVATAGYSIYIYHITPEEADRAREEMLLPPVREKVDRFGGTP